MFRYLSVLIAVILLLSIAPACKKNDNTTCQSKTPDQELPEMKKYASDNGMNATQDASGILYEIVTPGSGTYPAVTSTVTVKYTGKLLNGSVFDSNQTGVTFKLSEVITGWQLAVPKLKPGGKMKVIIPSSLAYGCSPYAPQEVKGKILYFDIELISIQ